MHSRDWDVDQYAKFIFFFTVFTAVFLLFVVHYSVFLFVDALKFDKWLYIS